MFVQKSDCFCFDPFVPPHERADRVRETAPDSEAPFVFSSQKTLPRWGIGPGALFVSGPLTFVW